MRVKEVGARVVATIDRLRNMAADRSPIRSFIQLFLAGALSTLAMAPAHFWLILLVSLPVLLWSLEPHAHATLRQRIFAGLYRGWAFGFGYHLAGLYWIGGSFLVQAERFALLMPFAIALLTAALGLFMAGAMAAYLAVRPRLAGPLCRLVAFALLIAVSEWLRGHILTGFPWNVFGYALTMPLALMQTSGLVGIYVLSGLTVLILSAPLVLICDGPPRWRSILALSILPLSCSFIYGSLRLASTPTQFVDYVSLRLVQPSFSQADKFVVEKRGEIFRRHLDMSRNATLSPDALVVRPQNADARPDDTPTHVIWPEAAMPFFLRREPAALAAFRDTLSPSTVVIAGTYRASVPPGTPTSSAGNYDVFNSAMVIDGAGEILASYDKLHLVPFGEYLPAQSLLTALGFENLTRAKGGLAAGQPPRRNIEITGLPPAVILICYEASFPGAAAQRSKRPGVLINLTNDAWFGETSGPYQHLHQTRVRAVEQGLPMVRSANNGISAIIDPAGRMIAELPLNAVGVIDSRLPAVTDPPPYARWPGAIELTALIAALMSTIGLAVREWPGHSRPETRRRTSTTSH